MSLITVHRFVVACGVLALAGYAAWIFLRGPQGWSDGLAAGGALIAALWFGWYWTTIPSRYGVRGAGRGPDGAGKPRS